VVGIRDVFNIPGYAMSLKGELGDANDFTVFKVPGVRAQGAVSHVLASFFKIGTKDIVLLYSAMSIIEYLPVCILSPCMLVD
jgi:hypothetical protein